MNSEHDPDNIENGRDEIEEDVPNATYKPEEEPMHPDEGEVVTDNVDTADTGVENSQEFEPSELKDTEPAEAQSTEPSEIQAAEPSETPYVGPTEERVHQAKQSYVSSQQPVAPKKGNRRFQYIALLLALVLIIGASFAVIMATFDSDLYPGGDKVAVIYVQGVMLSGSIPGGFGFVTSEEISENLREAAEDEDVKAIVLRINSPGGSPAASEEIVSEIKRVQGQGIPVVVSMGDVGASAAYYISAPSDFIMANPSTMTGSIGVIWTFQDLSEFYEVEGVKFHVAKSGDFKDMGANWRPLSDEEKDYADEVILDVFDGFVTEVAEGRNMSEDDVREIADGRIYTGAEAKKIGLVDDFGNLYEAADVAADLGNIEGDYTIVYMNKPSLSRLLFGSDAQSSALDVEGFVSYYEDNQFGKIVA